MKASTWIKVRSSLPTDGRLLQVARRLGVSPNAALGALIRMWILADQLAQKDGTLAGWTPDELDQWVREPGFAAALPADWLVVRDEGLTFPNYAEHNGSTTKTRLQAALRARGR